MNKRILRKAIPLAVGVLSFGSGVALGYVLGSRRRRETVIVKVKKESEQEQQLELPFDEAKKETSTPVIVAIDGDGEVHYSDGTSFYPEYDPNDAANDRSIFEREVGGAEDVLPEHVQNPMGGSTNDEGEMRVDDRNEIVPLRSMFKNPRTEDWDYYTELQKRGDEPYIIHYDEFINDEMGYSQTTITYFEKDNILCDENDVPMYDWPKLVGKLEFGKGSNDPNVVYIRNPRLEMEWEVLYSSSSYAQEVLGLDAEDTITSKKKNLKHEVPRFRME